MKTHTIQHEVKIKAKPSQIFEAFTTPSKLEDWWPLKCTGEAEMGSTYNFNFTVEHDWYAEVTKIVKGKQCWWKVTESDPDWDSTSFGFKLTETEEEDGTYLTFKHIGWRRDNQHYRITSYSWAILLKALKDYVESSTIIPFENRG